MRREEEEKGITRRSGGGEEGMMDHYETLFHPCHLLLASSSFISHIKSRRISLFAKYPRHTHTYLLSICPSINLSGYLPRIHLSF